MTGKRLLGQEITGHLLVRNTFLNLVGYALPLLIAIAAIPFIVAGLGIERFGLLSLAWVILMYLAMFDLGLARATTKYVAEAVGKGDLQMVPRVVWTTVTMQTALGMVAAGVLIAATPWLVEKVLKISPQLILEAKGTFHVLALSLPIVFVSNCFTGVLQAGQRFDLVNAVRIPSSSATFLLPALGVVLGLGLPVIVALIVTAKLLGLCALVLLSYRVFPNLRRWASSLSVLPQLFEYGGWVTVSSVAGPALVYMDRFFLASLISLSAVAYYTAPFELITRLAIVPGSLAAALFPAFSTLDAEGDRERSAALFARAVKYLTLIVGTILLVVAVFASDILNVWLGPEFAERSALVLQLLALGVFVNSLAYVPYTFLQGVGRPKIPAIVHVVELPLYVPILWLSIREWGVVGAAGAWTFRVALDAGVLFAAASRFDALSGQSLRGARIGQAAVAILVLGFSSFPIAALAEHLDLWARIGLVAALFAIFVVVIWTRVFDSSDRGSIAALMGLLKQKSSIGEIR